MICFTSPEDSTLFLFVADNDELQQPPSPTPEFRQVSKLITVSWSTGGKSYLLAGTGDEDSLRRDAGF